MSLKETLLGLIDNVSLPAIFSRKPENLKELRQPLIKGIANARRQFESGQTRAPHRWWKLSNDVVALTVKISGNVFLINGAETNHIPSDRFPEFLDKFNDAVEAGEFDEELRNKGTGDAEVKVPKAKRKAATPVKTLEVPPNEPSAAPASEGAAPVAKPARKSKATAKRPRKPIDAKTAHARAIKAAATRAANKATKAETSA